jgi:hypothetical protein
MIMGETQVSCLLTLVNFSKKSEATTSALRLY